MSGGFLDRRSVHLPDSDGCSRSTSSPRAVGPRCQIRSEEASGWFATRQWKLDLSEPSIPHQVATNRVCDSIYAHADPRAPAAAASASSRSKRRSRPDAVYEAREGRDGNKLVWLEVDLGHYNRKRLIEKVQAFRESRQACMLLIACSTETRADWVARRAAAEVRGHRWSGSA